MNWFTLVVNLIDKSTISGCKKLASALCIAHCITLPPDKSNILCTCDLEDFFLQLAGLLKFHPDDAKNEYEFLCSRIPLDLRFEFVLKI